MKTHKVYVLLNEYGTVEYVGETNDIRKRFNHHKCNTKSSGSGKFYGRTDITLEVVKEFDNRKEALKYEGQLKQELGFEWSENIRRIKVGKITGSKNGKTRNKPITAYIKDTGEYVGSYPSLMECHRQLNIPQSRISDCIAGRKKSALGYTFKLEVK